MRDGMRKSIIAIGIALVALLASVDVASADTVDLYVKQVRSSREYKLRLSAALKLSRLRDERAVLAIAYALRHDSKRTVRRVAALSLSKMVDRSLPASVRKKAIAALEYARSRDRDPKVRKNAKNALGALRGLQSDSKSKVYLRIAVPRDRTRRSPSGTTRRMHLALRKMLRTKVPKLAQDWPTGRQPTKRQLARRGAKAFFIGTSVAKLSVRKSRGRAEIRCSVSVRVSPWEGRDGNERWQANKSASATGNGKVIGAVDALGIANAKRDCLLAVTEQITARQVVPFLRRLTR